MRKAISAACALGVMAAGTSMLEAVEFTIPLTTAEEVPAPVLGGATPSGEVVLSIDTTTGAMTADGTYEGMTSAVSAAHLHGPAWEGETAGVFVGLTTSGGTSGTISGGGMLTPDQLEAVLEGRTYVNVHTANNGGGEIRGQVRSDDVRIFLFGLDAAQEVPAPNLGGATPSGTARVVLQVSTGDIEVVGAYEGMTSAVSAAHLHGLADRGVPAGVLFGFATTGGTAGTLSGKSVLNAANQAGLLAGLTYVNVHTANNGSGEIRGQVADHRLRRFAIPLTAEEEIPAPTLGEAMPSGEARVVVDLLTGATTVRGSYAGMTSAVGAAHLHGLADRGVPAGVLFGFTTTGGTTGTFSGSGTLSPSSLEGLLAGRTYVNVHTANNGSGEIRGQVDFVPATLPPVRLVPVAEDAFVSPTAVTHAGDGSGRLFVVEQRGQVRVLSGGIVLPDPFLDIENRLVSERSGFDERGLLGLAFHPDFGSPGAPGEGRFYVYYSAPSPNETDPGDPDPVNHRSVVAEFRVDAGDPDSADPDSERILLTFDQPQFNHNGGQLAFGPDGLLHVSTGDGGSSNDNNAGHTGGSSQRPASALGNAQDRTKLLGKILRIDPLGTDGPGGEYGIPPENPFVGAGGGIREEILAYGLRNPWRFSFDDGFRGSDRLFCADVGQGLVEEVNLIQPGRNYGWRRFEGTFDFEIRTPAEGPFEAPIAEYAHPGAALGLLRIGLSVTGGAVYRGLASPTLDGLYLFADWSADFAAPSGTLLGLTEDEDGGFRLGILPVEGGNPLDAYVPAFGVDEVGEVYVATKRTLAASALDPDTNTPTGSLFRIATGPERIRYEFPLTTDQEVPAPNLGDASPVGAAVVEVDPASGRVTIAGTYQGMTSAVQAAHLHGLADPGTPAGVLFGLDVSGGTEGRFAGSGTLDEAGLAGLLAGRTYINVHTVNNGAGEIRGQVAEVIAVDPRLTIEWDGTSVTVSWEDPAGTLILEESPDLAAWGETARPVQSDGTRHSVVIVEPGGRFFFRLR